MRPILFPPKVLILLETTELIDKTVSLFSHESLRNTRVLITAGPTYEAIDPEAQKRTLDFIERNAKAGKPFYVANWPMMSSFLPVRPKCSRARSLLQDGLECNVDIFVGQVMDKLKELGIAENTLVVIMADNGPMTEAPNAMYQVVFNGGKGDYREGGIRVAAFAEWPGVIEPGTTIGDMITVHDLFTTFARLGNAIEYIPTDRIIDGIDQTSLLLNGDTHSRRDYVFIYAGHTLGATVKGRYKRHWIGSGDVAASGMPEAYYDLYQDPHEKNPHLVPLIHTQGQFNRMLARHELFKKKYPDMPNGHGIPYTGLSNARPETKAIGERIKRQMASMPFDVEECIAGVRRIQPEIEVLQLASLKDEGMNAWLGWLEQTHPTTR